MKKEQSCDLIRKGYKVILVLPSYEVLQDPKTFHTVVFCIKQHSKGTILEERVGQFVIPGLSNDPHVQLPAKMWQEIVSNLSKNTAMSVSRVGQGNPRQNTARETDYARVYPTLTTTAPIIEEVDVPTLPALAYDYDQGLRYFENTQEAREEE